MSTVPEPVVLSEHDAAEIAAFTRQSCEFDPLSATSVRRSVFAETDDQVVLGLYEAGLDAVGAAVVRGRTGFVKFLAVHPAARGRGFGGALLERLEAFCLRAGATTISVGHCAPYYVTPGVDVRSTELLCLLAARGYRRRGESVNQSVRLHGLPPPPLPVHHASDREYAAIRSWLSGQHPNWLDEADRAQSYGTLIVHEDLGFACYDVNREGWFGPMATLGGPGGKGVGTSTLLGCLHAMRAAGHERADIAWVGPIVFYAKAVGARINRVFWSYEKAAPEPDGSA